MNSFITQNKTRGTNPERRGGDETAATANFPIPKVRQVAQRLADWRGKVRRLSAVPSGIFFVVTLSLSKGLFPARLRFLDKLGMTEGIA